MFGGREWRPVVYGQPVRPATTCPVRKKRAQGHTAERIAQILHLWTGERASELIKKQQPLKSFFMTLFFYKAGLSFLFIFFFIIGN